MTEKIACFVAPYREAGRTGKGGGVDEDEHIEVLEIPFGEALAMVESGRSPTPRRSRCFTTQGLRGSLRGTASGASEGPFQAPSSGHCLLQNLRWERSLGEDNMATFDSLIEILASRFGLGATARLLVSEVVAMISASPGGLGGFLDKLKSAGLASEVASWLGHPDAAPIAAGQVERALGATALSGIASRMGLEQSIVTPALGYAVPRIVGPLDAGRRCSSRRPRRDHGLSLTTASRGGGGAGRAEADRRSPDKRAKRARRRALAMARGRGHRRDWPAFVFLVGVQPNGARREGARACNAAASDRRTGADPAAGSRARSASPGPRDNRANDCAPGSAGSAARRPCPGTFDGRTSDGFSTAGAACSVDGRKGEGVSSADAVAVNQRTSDSSRPAGFASAGGASARHYDFARNDRTGFNAASARSRREG